MTTLVNQLKGQGHDLYNKRGALVSLWQEIASHFYVERADFIVQRMLGADFAANLMTSYPLMMRRDLGNLFGSMLRPSAKDWFRMRSKRQDKVDTDGKQWLEWFSKMQKEAMYDRVALFARATSEADHDYAAFGQAVIQCRYIYPRDGSTPHLMHQGWHLRDVAWSQNDFGVIDTVYRKTSPPVRNIIRTFAGTAHPQIEQLARNKPWDTHEIQHVVMPTEVYLDLDNPNKTDIRQPFVSIWFDPGHDCVMEEKGLWLMEYVIPRWQTVSGSQYAHSPATVAALPDARLIQNMTQVILEAGQKATSPPMIGVREAIRSDIDIRAGGFTAVDPDYDERMGEVLRPLTQDIKGFHVGPELVKDLREQMKDQFYLNKLSLPPTTGERVTAFEIAQRVQEFVRNALPLFEPVESDYNGQVCETDMQLILRNNPGIVRDMPDSLKGSAFTFVFESPLRDAVDKAKIGQFQEAQQIIAAAQALDPSATFIIDGEYATRDVLEAAVPAKWLRNADAVSQMAANAKAAQQRQQLLDLMAQGAKVAKDSAAAGSDAAGALSQLGPA